MLVIVGGFFIAAGVDFVDQGYSDDGVANILAGSIISTLGSLLILVAVLAKAVQVGLRSVTFNGTTFERRVEPKQWSISRPSP
ncbi:hypothetical protein HMPREF0063_10557 [Aeromicrobium marinum DSM 15272]|uniref:Uncharacterized protein n=1 Tax=Aeromicrobium marinum DSM 15272 TaxID=585531 RepID=E2S9B7_9ACTN|nr:hypothetical protein HMPREF0063_10557 [Aeromicrobium marinum DSM 15272]